MNRHLNTAFFSNQTPGGNRHNRLVPVTVRLLGGNDRAELHSDINPRQTLKLAANLLLLQGCLGAVLNSPQRTASAALLGIWTHILCPVPGGFNHFHKSAEGIALFNLGNLRPHPVSGKGIRHKDHHAAFLSHAAGAAGLLPADALPHVAHIFNCQFNNHSFFHFILSLHLRVAPIPSLTHQSLST